MPYSVPTQHQYALFCTNPRTYQIPTPPPVKNISPGIWVLLSLSDILKQAFDEFQFVVMFSLFQPCPRTGCITSILSLDGSVLPGDTPTTTAPRKVCGSCLQCSWCFSPFVKQRSKLVPWTRTFSADEFLICKRQKCQVLAYGRQSLHNKPKFSVSHRL